MNERLIENETTNVVLLGGDGIGPEVGKAAKRIIEEVSGVTVNEHLIGGASIDEYNEPLTDEVLAACADSDAIMLGAVGGPKWENHPSGTRPEQGLLGLRKELCLYANLRPVRQYQSLIDSSPLKKRWVEGTDMLIVRESTGGVYFGESGRDQEGAFDTYEYDSPGISRIVYDAFQLAQERGWERDRTAKVTSVVVDKDMETSQLWHTVTEGISQHYPEVEVEHMEAGQAAGKLLRKPKQFDVLVTENMVGDILSDEIAMIVGSIGTAPSATLNYERLGMFEAIHGSAPDLAGKDEANPIGAIRSVGMMFRYGLDRAEPADRIEEAVEMVLEKGYRTPDLMPADTNGYTEVGTTEMTDVIIAELSSSTDRRTS